MNTAMHLTRKYIGNVTSVDISIDVVFVWRSVVPVVSNVKRNSHATSSL